MLQPSGPASTGLTVIFSVFGLNPCHLATDMQMCFGVKQFFRAFGVFGSDAFGDQREGVRADFFRVRLVDERQFLADEDRFRGDELQFAFDFFRVDRRRGRVGGRGGRAGQTRGRVGRVRALRLPQPRRDAFSRDSFLAQPGSPDPAARMIRGELPASVAS